MPSTEDEIGDADDQCGVTSASSVYNTNKGDALCPEGDAGT